jgi:hypothetical protein
MFKMPTSLTEQTKEQQQSMIQFLSSESVKSHEIYRRMAVQWEITA